MLYCDLGFGILQFKDFGQIGEDTVALRVL
jgi:hypothetical protein